MIIFSYLLLFSFVQIEIYSSMNFSRNKRTHNDKDGSDDRRQKKPKIFVAQRKSDEESGDSGNEGGNFRSNSSDSNHEQYDATNFSRGATGFSCLPDGSQPDYNPTTMTRFQPSYGSSSGPDSPSTEDKSSAPVDDTSDGAQYSSIAQKLMVSII